MKTNFGLLVLLLAFVPLRFVYSAAAEDTASPVINCPSDLTLACGQASDPVHIGAPSAADDSGEVCLHFADETIPGSCSAEFAIHRTWTATDPSGNESRCTQTISVNDATPPVLTCPPDVTVACEDSIDPCATGRATATDACGGDAAPCNDGLLLYYSFDTNEGAMVSDLSGHARNGTVNGATFTPGGIQGGARSFDGVDDFIETCDAGFPDGDKPRSLALWVNFSDINPQDEEFVASYGSPNEHVSPDNQWNALCLDTRAGRQHMAFTQDGGVYVSAATITAGQWVHVVHTYNGNNSHKIYINGAESFEQNELFGSLNTILSGRFLLGAHVYMEPGKPLFGGLMDEVRVYNRALSAAEVQDLYAQPCPASQAALSYQDTAVAEGCPRVIERIWTATDACGNSSQCVQTITIQDTTPPELSGVPNDLTVECNQVPAPPTVTATDNCCPPPPAVDALLLHYAFDTDEGGVVSDLSGHGHHGIPYGAVWTPFGKYSGAYAFDGDADYIDLGPTDAYAPPAGQLSAASWIYMQDREITILSNYHGGPGYSGQFFFIVDADGIFNVILGQGPGQYLRYLATKPDIIPLNEWHHVAFSYDESRGAGNKIKLYVDGKDIGQYLVASEGTGGPVLQIGEHLRAMAHGTGTNNRPGMLDELRVYQSALSPEEVMKLFLEKPAACTPTIDFLETDDGQDCPRIITRIWTATDACGNTASASQVITVADTSPPELFGVPADTTLPCVATIPPLPEVTAYDNCDGAVAVLISGDIGLELPVYPLAGTAGGGCEQIITRTWTATDSCGNSISDSQTITIQDTTPPELIGVPDDLTVECNQVPTPPTVTATDNCCPPPPAVDALLLHYAFDTDEGGVVSDLSGHGHHGIPTGAVWTPFGKYSGAYAFDGDADYIDLGPTDAYAPPAGQLSAAGWIYMQDREITILSNYHGGPGYSGQFFFIVDADGIFNVILGQGPGQYLRYLATQPDIIPLNEWHHVAFSYDESRGPGNKIKLYVDGKDIGQYLIASEGTGGPVLQIGEHLRAMAHGTGTNSRPGVLDELRVYQSALSPEEVMQLFLEKPAACAPTIDFLETNDGQDCPRIITRIWTATDACGNSTSLSQIIVAVQDPALDSDGDAIPDAWEFRYSGSTIAMNAEGDPDNDGFDNLSEYIADTDPFDSTSFFNQEHPTHNSPAMFHFLSSAQRVYTLEYSLDLHQVPWQPVPGQLKIPGTGGMMTLTDTRDFENCSYRILAELP